MKTKQVKDDQDCGSSCGLLVARGTYSVLAEAYFLSSVVDSSGIMCRRSGPASRVNNEIQLAPDPDNIPPRSRLFMVVPKTAIGSAIEVYHCSSLLIYLIRMLYNRDQPAIGCLMLMQWLDCAAGSNVPVQGLGILQDRSHTVKGHCVLQILQIVIRAAGA